MLSTSVEIPRKYKNNTDIIIKIPVHISTNISNQSTQSLEMWDDSWLLRVNEVIQLTQT